MTAIKRMLDHALEFLTIVFVIVLAVVALGIEEALGGGE